jgi:hypothetical protein
VTTGVNEKSTDAGRAVVMATSLSTDSMMDKDEQ